MGKTVDLLVVDVFPYRTTAADPLERAIDTIFKSIAGTASGMVPHGEKTPGPLLNIYSVWDVLVEKTRSREIARRGDTVVNATIDDKAGVVCFDKLPEPDTETLALFNKMKDRNRRVNNKSVLEGVLFVYLEPYTIAIVKTSRRGKVNLRIGKARCLPPDKFDFKIGKEVAFSNAFDQ